MMSQKTRVGKFDPATGRGPFGNCLFLLTGTTKEDPNFVLKVAMAGDLFYVARSVVSEHGYDEWTPGQRLEAILAVYKVLAPLSPAYLQPDALEGAFEEPDQDGIYVAARSPSNG